MEKVLLISMSIISYCKVWMRRSPRCQLCWQTFQGFQIFKARFIRALSIFTLIALMSALLPDRVIFHTKQHFCYVRAFFLVILSAVYLSQSVPSSSDRQNFFPSQSRWCHDSSVHLWMCWQHCLNMTLNVKVSCLPFSRNLNSLKDTRMWKVVDTGKLFRRHKHRKSVYGWKVIRRHEHKKSDIDDATCDSARRECECVWSGVHFSIAFVVPLSN